MLLSPLFTIIGTPVGATNTHEPHLHGFNNRISNKYFRRWPLYVPPNLIINYYSHHGRWSRKQYLNKQSSSLCKMHNYNLQKRCLNQSKKKILPQAQYLPWDKDDVISGNIHQIVHIPNLMISKTLDDDTSKLDPLKVYKVLHKHDLLTTKSARYKPIVNHNIWSFFVAAGNLCWNKSAISK